MATSCDVLVVGGGPAGSALAWHLARAGIAVAIVDHGRAHHSGPYETLLPSSVAMLARSGLLDLVREAAQPDVLRHGSIWGSEELRWQDAGAPGLVLQRGAFDAALRRAAAAAGAVVWCPARVGCRLGGPAGAAVSVELPGGQRATLRPQVVAVATGRSRLGTLLATEASQVGPRTFALTMVGELPAEERNRAVVEAVPDGWLWLHAPALGPASVAVVLDAAAVAEHGGPAAAARALGQARGPAGRLRDFRLAAATDATARCASSRTDVLLVGDAAATIDPLASQGVEKALAAADHAAAVLRTMLQQPALRVRLRDEHRRWEFGIQRAHAAQAAAYHLAEARFAEAPFWRRRRTGPAQQRAAPSPDAPLTLAAGVEVGPALRRIGDRFEPCAGASCGDVVLTHLGFVPVPPLLALFEAPRTLAQAQREAGRDPQLFVLPPFAVQQALRELWQRGWIRPAASAAGNQ